MTKNPRVRHPWTEFQRQTLCLLRKHYSNKWKNVSDIFNHLFERELNGSGYHTGMPLHIIQTQWHTLRNKQASVYNRVEACQHPSGTYKHILLLICEAAQKLGIQLLDAGSATVSNENRPTWGRNHQSFSDHVRSDPSDHSMSSLHYPTPVSGPLVPNTTSFARFAMVAAPTPKMEPSTMDITSSPMAITTPTRTTGSLCAMAPSPIFPSPVTPVTISPTTTSPTRNSADSLSIIDCSSEDVSTEPDSVNDLPESGISSISCDERPRLLFRFWCKESNGTNTFSYFAAGLWGDRTRDIPPPELDNRITESLARTHLIRCQVNSPFISLFDTLLSPVHRAMKHEDGVITVFDFSSFDASRLFSAQEVLKNKPLPIKTKYAGHSEYMVWGDITAEHIVGSIRARDLLELPARYKEIILPDTIGSFRYNGNGLKRALRESQTPGDLSTGHLLGQLLAKARFPESYAVEIALKVAESWKFQIPENDLTPFTTGVTNAYHEPRQIATAAVTNDDDWQTVHDSDSDCVSENDDDDENWVTEDEESDDGVPQSLDEPCPELNDEMVCDDLPPIVDEISDDFTIRRTHIARLLSD